MTLRPAVIAIFVGLCAIVVCTLLLFVFLAAAHLGRRSDQRIGRDQSDAPTASASTPSEASRIAAEQDAWNAIVQGWDR